MIEFKLTDLAKRHKMTIDECVGDIKHFASPQNETPLREQLNKWYQHGGGWCPMEGFELKNKETHEIQYPEDAPLLPLATAQFRNQTICVYPYAFVAIFEQDGSFEIARMD